MSGITLCPELHRVRNYIVFGITLCPILHRVRKYIVSGIIHTHKQCAVTASALAPDDVWVDRGAAAAVVGGGH